MVFLDVSAIIYLLEGKPELRESARRILAGLRSDETLPALAVSALSLLECRVQPIRRADDQRLEIFDQFFSDPGLMIVDVDRNVIQTATGLRARYGLRTPDAIQAASALAADVDVDFVTGDNDFQSIPNLRVHLVV